MTNEPRVTVPSIGSWLRQKGAGTMTRLPIYANDPWALVSATQVWHKGMRA